MASHVSSEIVLILFLLGLGCAHDASRMRTADLHEPGFFPSVEGKKLLHYRGPSPDYMKNSTEEMEQIALDGLILGGYRPFYMNEKEFNLEEWAKKMREIPFERYTDNFYLIYSSVDAIDTPDFDWFHDFDWVIERWARIAATARDAGFKGICFDSEYYAGRPLFGYHRQKYAEEKTFEEYQAQVRLRGAEIMRAVRKEYPDITILFLFGYSGSFMGVPQHPVRNAQNYTLVSAFVDGMLFECGDEATIHDMHEQSFAFRVPGSYARSRRMIKTLFERESAFPEQYARHHKVGFSLWIDAWGDNSKGRAFDVNDFETNFYTPEELAYTIHHSLAYSDRYVWMWPGAIDWWKRTVKTLNESGEEVDVPLPEEYIQALENARKPTLPEPPRDRKPNNWRVMEARTQDAWSDEEAFGDLWDNYDYMMDLPIEWAFQLDPDEIGIRKAWYSPDLDDSDWDRIRIREFWEVQGYTPYDGCAWYRTPLTIIEPLEPGKNYYIAFGGVSDEAAVYVNGKLAYASEVGENIRHKRFLVNVTDLLNPEAENQVTVRVWNVSWCGGIWKNVKLIRER